MVTSAERKREAGRARHVEHMGNHGGFKGKTDDSSGTEGVNDGGPTLAMMGEERVELTQEDVSRPREDTIGYV
jgi:hypothetical protein